MTKSAWFALMLLMLVLAGCSGTPSCLKHQSYMDAKSFPPLRSPPGLEVPRPEPSTRVPEVAGGPVGTYDEPPAGVSADNPAARCLITPPPMKGA